MKLGFAGLGRMGSRMAANCVGAGYDVMVWNRSPGPVEAFVEAHAAKAAPGPKNLAAANDMVVTVLANDEAARAVYLGPEGLIEVPGADLLVEMGTMSPDLVRELAGAAARAGKTFVDAPVSGATQAAQDAQLLIIAGCEGGAYPLLAEVFDAMGRKTIWLGSAGAGAVMKLAVNMLIHGLNQTVCEALILAGRAGISERDAFDVFENSAAAAPMLSYRRSLYLDEAGQDVSFTIDLAHKDVKLALALANDLGVGLPQTQTTLGMLEHARSAGFGSRDMASILAFMKGQAR
ncbi:MAG: NAD(P)-dependent oxidoreductase [Hoeflea sp.]|uniref:NAD(P)-dependent oxidoreductase n=1 Tax=Hoeflea sp. TaxID=1940281 RepID=UPI001DD2B658|nr:NAD(P)-dependent oxidoreductase [Hoeflea sp.]MBU4531877.1 NAD(P)-dependent oxidoreductase [Alphaproteobacteria bacterium]MBU4546299.1 NAD(P)-dependent oxidoreductase [Alphaproteobacteria bacterium]MBU4549428.1 NAD(P)-dependent oxidoreductase [Alphaproteobacteria bacterium]MBV1722603.1 NAD(P)-dependent oxidoreductase [Hoeflea sp.]MBV1782541.1 NAD(P)-dependent oxidoreductase [Hoeflea sp.]